MKKIISILLCYCILMLPSGCRSSKPLTADDAATMKRIRNFLVLHTPTRTYKMYDYKFTTDSIEGNLRIYPPGQMTNTINIYTEMNFELKLDRNSSKYTRLSKNDITKITYKKFSLENTILLTLGVFGSIAILAVIVANSMSFDINLSGM